MRIPKILRINYKKKHLDQKTLHSNVLINDALVVSISLYIILSWFDWREPRSVSYFFSPNIFLYLTAFFTLCFIALHKERIIHLAKTINPLYLSRLAIISITSSSIIYFLISQKEINGLAQIYIATSLLSFFAILLLIGNNTSYFSLRKNKKVPVFVYVLLLITVFIGGVNIFYKLDRNDIFHEEKWHVQVIESLKNDSGFKKWNFLSNSPEGTYRRGRVLNMSEFLIVENFGQNNFTLRFIPALTGLVILPLVFYVFKIFIGTSPALLTTIAVSFSIPYIFLARFLRPYSTFLFFYLLSFFLSYKFIESLRDKRGMKRLFLLGFSLFIVIVLTVQASQFGKILILLIPLSFLFSFATHRELRSRLLWNKRRIIHIAIISLLFLGVLEILKVTNFYLVFEQAEKYLLLTNILNPETTYFEYLFTRYTKANYIIYLSFIIGTLLLVWKVFTKKHLASFHLLSFTLIPLFFIIFLLSRYEDFRYCYFVIPFVYGTSMFGFFITFKAIFSSTFHAKPKKMTVTLAATFFALVFVVYPVLPIKTLPGITLASPSVWDDEEGQDLLHRRAIAPEYKKAFDYINKNQRPDDNVVIGEGEYYLETSPGTHYFSAPRKSKFLAKGNGSQTIDFFNLINSNKKLYFVSAYAHLLDKELLNYLLSNCENKSESLGIKKYSYTGYYEKRNLYWPSLFVCN